MVKEDFYFDSSDGKTKIHGVKWIPDGNVKMILQVVHGVTEHILRYDEFANYFNNMGIMVVGIDLIGHGTSIAVGVKPMYFGGVGSFEYVVDDLYKCKEIISKDFDSNITYCMLGFSLGSFLARMYAIKYPSDLDGMILVGTGYTSSIEIALARFIANKEAHKYGEDKSSDMIRKLTFETYNNKFKPNRTRYDWLCLSEEALEKYINDPLRGGDMSSGLFREMLYGMKFTGEKSNIMRMNKELPILLLSGSDDPVGNSGKGINKYNTILKKCGINDVDIKIYSKLRHDILHEDNRVDIYNDIREWLVNKGFLVI